jgi:hypothetical protein
MRGTDFGGSRLAKWSDFNAVRLRNLTLSPEYPAEATRGHKTRSFPDGLFFCSPRIPRTIAASHPTLQAAHNKMNSYSNYSDVPDNPSAKRRRISLACSACRTRKSRVRHLTLGELFYHTACAVMLSGTARNCEDADGDPQSAMEFGLNVLAARNWALNASMSTLRLPRMSSLGRSTYLA